MKCTARHPEAKWAEVMWRPDNWRCTKDEGHDGPHVDRMWHHWTTEPAEEKA